MEQVNYLALVREAAKARDGKVSDEDLEARRSCQCHMPKGCYGRDGWHFRPYPGNFGVGIYERCPVYVRSLGREVDFNRLENPGRLAIYLRPTVAPRDTRKRQIADLDKKGDPAEW